MAAVIICSGLGAQKNKVCHCFHCFPIYLPGPLKSGGKGMKVFYSSYPTLTTTAWRSPEKVSHAHSEWACSDLLSSHLFFDLPVYLLSNNWPWAWWGETLQKTLWRRRRTHILADRNAILTNIWALDTFPKEVILLGAGNTKASNLFLTLELRQM